VAALTAQATVALSFRAEGDLLEWIDTLAPDETGALAFERVGEGPVGAVFVERNRVCWAAAEGLARRLVDLLREDAALRADRGTVESLFRRARDEHRPFGELLVSSGLVSATAFRDALQRHTAESIAQLVRDRAVARWAPRSGGYSARFSFRTTDLLVAHHAIERPEQAFTAQASLLQVVGEDEVALALIREPGEARARVVALRGAFEGGVVELQQLAAWAIGLGDVGDAISGRARAVIARDDTGRSVAVWREHELIVVAWVGHDGLARIIRRRSAARTAPQGDG
jgi:hypothetical protein